MGHSHFQQLLTQNWSNVNDFCRRHEKWFLYCTTINFRCYKLIIKLSISASLYFFCRLLPFFNYHDTGVEAKLSSCTSLFFNFYPRSLSRNLELYLLVQGQFTSITRLCFYLLQGDFFLTFERWQLLSMLWNVMFPL